MAYSWWNLRKLPKSFTPNWSSYQSYHLLSVVSLHSIPPTPGNVHTSGPNLEGVDVENQETSAWSKTMKSTRVHVSGFSLELNLALSTFCEVALSSDPIFSHLRHPITLKSCPIPSHLPGAMPGYGSHVQGHRESWAQLKSFDSTWKPWPLHLLGPLALEPGGPVGPCGWGAAAYFYPSYMWTMQYDQNDQ